MREPYPTVPIPDHYLPPPSDGLLRKREHLRAQLQCVKVGSPLVCSCRQVIRLERAYKCLYCGLWFCVTCAEIHFGQTRSAYRLEHPEH